MKLYYSSGACGISPSIALHEAGLDFDIISVDLQTKLTENGQDFYEINNKGSIPVLEISKGNILTEGPAILQYIADQVPEKKLAPVNGTMERYYFQEKLNFITSELHKGFPVFFKPVYKDLEDVKQIARDTLIEKFSYINKILEKQNYIMGDDFTLADAYLYNVTRWTEVANIDVKSEFLNLCAFMARMEERPSVKKALQGEGVDLFCTNNCCAA